MLAEYLSVRSTGNDPLHVPNHLIVRDAMAALPPECDVAPPPPPRPPDMDEPTTPGRATRSYTTTPVREFSDSSDDESDDGARVMMGAGAGVAGAGTGAAAPAASRRDAAEADAKLAASRHARVRRLSGVSKAAITGSRKQLAPVRSRGKGGSGTLVVGDALVPGTGAGSGSSGRAASRRGVRGATSGIRGRGRGRGKGRGRGRGGGGGRGGGRSSARGARSTRQRAHAGAAGAGAGAGSSSSARSSAAASVRVHHRDGVVEYTRSTPRRPDRSPRRPPSARSSPVRPSDSEPRRTPRSRPGNARSSR